MAMQKTVLLVLVMGLALFKGRAGEIAGRTK